MTFKAIETQEELDQIIQDRLRREREKFSDYDGLKKANEDYEKQIGSLQAQIEESSQTIKSHDQVVADLNSKITGYETNSLKTKIALKHGLPIDLVDRLTGDDEASITADAEKLAGFVKQKPTVPPLKDTEPPLGDEKDSAYKNLLKGLNIEGE
ncbi:DUF4355 domain-containing protein [Vagococcus fluvialis]|uniref:capsid assembly scaffolding protein Gp46 family protein n=1 Tax=Vagococcus fluvialis TaxID=2738 RepID=UPI001A8F30A7|nr:DUF4355 domain-containing protein [Vagococcus fluvialis]MBO0478731.1 DUF4355 domain-containing protein [Vagococcus fluvialis]MBO0484424.1 DUF4355 domain-containing protein [Vagococcus fluvialis]